MPVILEIPLLGEPAKLEAVHLPDHFLKCVAAREPDLAAALRFGDPPRPYTLSTFYRRQEQWYWRVALLQDELAEPFVAGLAAWTANPLPVRIEQLAQQPVSYESLMQEAVPAAALALRFLSPTGFRGQLTTYPLPDPVGMVQSWWGRWNAFAPVKLDRVLLDVAAVHLAVSHCRIHTRPMELGVGREMGFVGEVTLRVVQERKLGSEILRQLNALADFAVYCGTGERTAQGMGQTRRSRRAVRETEAPCL